MGKTAYLTSNKDIPERVTTHELRALPSSWAYPCHIALKEVLSAAFWRLSGVFQKNYLRILAPISGAMATLGLVVAAQYICGC